MAGSVAWLYRECCLTWQAGRRLSVVESQVAQRQAVTVRCVMDAMRCCASSRCCMLLSNELIRSCSSSSITAVYLHKAQHASCHAIPSG